MDLLVRVIHHDGEDARVAVAGVIHETRWTPEVEALNVIGGLAEEVEGENVRGGTLGDGVLVCFDGFGV